MLKRNYLSAVLRLEIKLYISKSPNTKKFIEICYCYYNSILNKCMMKNDKNLSNKKSGFTLVELSIVIVIIGLLIGGVLVGQSLIESASVNAQIKQVAEYEIAARNFFNKFKKFPADSNLFNVRGSNNNDYTNGTNCSAHSYFEPINFFPDLTKSQMIKENYVFTSSNSTQIGEGYELPKAKIGKGGISVSSTIGGNYFFHLGVATSIVANTNYGLGSTHGGIMSPTSAQAIDQKIDDGSFNSGMVAVSSGWSTGYDVACTRGSAIWPFELNAPSAGAGTYGKCINAGGTAYNLSSTTQLCALQIKMSYK